MEAYRIDEVADSVAEKLADVVSDLKREALDALKKASPCALHSCSDPRVGQLRFLRRSVFRSEEWRREYLFESASHVVQETPPTRKVCEGFTGFPLSPCRALRAERSVQSAPRRWGSAVSKLSLPKWAGVHAEIWSLAPQLGDDAAAQVRRRSGTVCTQARCRADDWRGGHKHVSPVLNTKLHLKVTTL